MSQGKKRVGRKPLPVVSKSRRAIRISRKAMAKDPVLSLSGLGKEIWKGIDADQYVKELRESWD